MKKAISFAILAAAVNFGCQEPTTSEQAPMDNLKLTGQQWTLSLLNGEAASLGDMDQALFIEFIEADATFRGFAGCNNYSGNYSQDGNNLEFGQSRATKKFCQQGSDIEDQYLSALTDISSYQINGDVLTLINSNNDEVAVYTAQATDK
ncbi:META domain-containing protein [Thalassotalea maritima]|uniref:META domain-containing protein n=1 Tax=Thalassotalea maritima TaxID=3242416 RepID=UPI003529AAE4